MKKLLIILLFLNFTLILNPVYSENVVFNPETHKVHKISCPSAIRCKSCIKIDRKVAYAKGGKPCHKCGG